MSYAIVRYRPEHKLGVARLQTALWSRDVARNVAYLEWKYERNPYTDAPWIWLALDGAEVVGMRGLSGARWVSGRTGADIEVLHADDMLVAERHRNAGIPRAILTAIRNEAASKGPCCLLSLTPSPVTTLVSLAAGWRVLARIRPVRRVSPRAAARRAARDRLTRMSLLWRVAGRLPFLYAAEERHPFASLDRWRARAAAHGPDGLSVEDAPRIEAMATLAADASGAGRLRHVRDAAYLAWRFASPLSRQRFLFHGDARRLAGYLVLEERQSSFASGVVTIADWEAPDPRVREELLRVAVEHGGFAELVAWSATLPDETRHMLERAGLCALDDAGTMSAYRSCVLLHATGEPPPFEPGDWDLRPLWAA